MGRYYPMVRPDGEAFMQWQPTEKGEEIPDWGPGHPVNPCCPICGARFFIRKILVPAKSTLRDDVDLVLQRFAPGARVPIEVDSDGKEYYLREDIQHDRLLHWKHKGDPNAAPSSVEMSPPRRTGDREYD